MAAGSGALLFSAAFFRYQAGVSGDLAVSGCSLSVVCSPPAFDAAGRCRAVSGCCAGAVRPAVRPVPGLSLNHYVQDVYVPMSGEDQEAYEKSLAIPGVVDKDRAKANARLEQAAKGTWLGDLIETQPVVKS